MGKQNIKVHSDYNIYCSEWRLMRDALKGNTKIKYQGVEYLAFPSNLPKNSSNSEDYYQKFLKLTDFPELTSQSLGAMLGLASSGANTLTFVDPNSYFSRIINSKYIDLLREVLSIGRVGVLVEFDNSDIGVNLLRYNAEDVINWHKDTLGNYDFVVLRQSVETFNDDTFGYDYSYEYIVLRLIDGVYTQEVRDKNFNLIDTKQPKIKGSSLSYIPFYVMTPYELNDEIRNSPLSPIAHLCLHIYRNKAIWNKLVATKGDPLLMFTGFSSRDLENLNYGGNNFIATNSSKSEADGKLIEMQTGAEFVSQIVNHDIGLAQAYAGKLLSVGSTAKESGESLIQRRLMAEIGLKSIIARVSEQYTKVINGLANMIGLNSKDPIIFKGFDEFSAKIQDIDDLMKASSLALNDIVSKHSLHDKARELGVTRYDYDEEQQMIADERNERV